MITFVIGPIDSGKSTWMLKHYAEQRRGDGFLAFKWVDDGKQLGYQNYRLSTGVQNPYIYRNEYMPPDVKERGKIGPYQLLESAVSQMEQQYKEMIEQCIQPVYIDEIGPLELTGAGLHTIFASLVESGLDLVVAVRTHCLEPVLKKYHIQDAMIIEINEKPQFRGAMKERTKTMDTWIINGQVMVSGNLLKTDILIQNGCIASIGNRSDILISEPAKHLHNVIDASGYYVLPGAIDAHVHLALPVSGTVSADDVTSGTMAAACGGVTTVIDFAHQERGKRLLQAIDARMGEFADNACVDYTFHGGITEIHQGTLAEMKACIEQGITSFKLYMTYPSVMLSDSDIRQVLQWCKELQVLPIVHAEDKDTIDTFVAALKAAGRIDALAHYESRPESAEYIADKKLYNWSRDIHVPIYIVHLASAPGVDLLRQAKEQGIPLIAETCPQYLHFTKEIYRQENGIHYFCSPAFKGKDSKQALWEGIKNGLIAVVATDHCPFMMNEKEWGRDDFTKTPNGLMGIETMYPFVLDAANRGLITFSQAVALCAGNTARLFGLSDKKGDLRVGMDADIVLYNPSKPITITQERMHSKTDYTVWEGHQLSGTIEQVLSKGKPVYIDGQFIGQAGDGVYVKCGMPVFDF